MNENKRVVAITAVFLLLAVFLLWVLGPGQKVDEGDGRVQAPETNSGADFAPTETIATDFGDGQITDLPAPKPDTVSTASRESRAPARARGVVYGTITGAPPTELTVRLHLVDWEPHEERPADALVLEQTPDEEGAFRFEGLKTGRYLLEGIAEGMHRRFDLRLTAGNLEAERSIFLRQVTTIEGIVVGPAREPVPGAEIFPVSYLQGTSERPILHSTASVSAVRSDDRGEFAVPNLVGTVAYKLVVRARGFAPYVSEYITPGARGVVFELSTGATASGHVVHAGTGEAAPGAVLRVAVGTALAQVQTRSDEDGRFEFQSLPSGEHRIMLVDAFLVVTDGTARFRVADGQETEGLLVEIAAGGVIAGQVVDSESGQGIGGVELEAAPQGLDIARDARASTESDGRYSIAGLAEGAYKVSYADVKGYPPVQGTANAKAVSVALGIEQTGVDFVLSRGLSVSGTVVDVEDLTIENVRVSSNDNMGGYDGSTMTDTQGRFRLPGYTAGTRHQFDFRKNGLAAPRMELTIAADGVSGLRIVMEPAASISGVIVDERGTPVPNVQFLAPPLPMGNSGIRVHNSDADGTFTVEDLVEGQYGIILEYDGNFSRQQTPDAEFSLALGEQLTGVEVVYRGAGLYSISGRVVSGRGEPVPRALVRAYASASANGIARADEAGVFSVGALPEGIYVVSAEHGSYSLETVLDVPEGTSDLEIRLRGRGTLRGRVVDARTGAPVTHFSAIAARRYNGPRYGPDLRVFNNPKGVYEFEKVEEGSVEIYVEARGYLYGFETATGIREGKTLEGPTIRLQPGGVVSGQVIDENGEAIIGAEIFLGEIPAFDRESAVRATSDAAGWFEIDSVPPGPHLVSAMHSRYAPGEASATVSADTTNPVQIVLRGGGIIEGRVTYGESPVANATVSASPSNQSYSQTTETDADGTFRFVMLSEGGVRVTARLPSELVARTRSVETEVAEGRVTVLDMDFAPGTASMEGRVYKAPGVGLGMVYISFSFETNYGSEWVHGQSDVQGFYSIEDLPEGSGRVRLSSQGGPNMIYDFELAGGERAQRNFHLYEGTTIHVIATNSPNPSRTRVIALRGTPALPERTSSFFRELQAEIVSEASLNNDGALTGLQPGTYTLLAYAFPRNFSPSRAYSNDYANMALATTVIEVSENDEEISIEISF